MALIIQIWYRQADCNIFSNIYDFIVADSRATVGDGKITDGPNEEVYDLQNCLMKNRDRKLGLGLSPINFAQPLTYLAEGE